MDSSQTSARWDHSSAYLVEGDIEWLPMVFNLERQLAETRGADWVGSAH